MTEVTVSDQLREIVGQDTTPPLWIYVTKNQVPVLERAAALLDQAAEDRTQAFVDGVVALARAIEGRHSEVQRLFAKYVMTE